MSVERAGHAAHLVYGAVKLLMFTVAGAFLVYRGAQEMFIYPAESAPTQLAVAQFPQAYAGQRWLSVTGRPAVEMGWSPPGNPGKRFVPMVVDEPPSGPIRVVIQFDDGARDTARHVPSTSDEFGQVTVIGFAAPPNAWDCERMFRGHPVADGVVVLYAGQGPPPKSVGRFMFYLGLGISLFCTWIYLSIYRGWRSRRARPEGFRLA